MEKELLDPEWLEDPIFIVAGVLVVDCTLIEVGDVRDIVYEVNLGNTSLVIGRADVLKSVHGDVFDLVLLLLSFLVFFQSGVHLT